MAVSLFFNIVASVLVIIAYIFYIKSILQKKSRPNKVTWIIWTALSGILAFSSLAAGELTTVWLLFSSFLVSLLITFLTFRYSVSKWSRVDIVCLVLAMLGLIPWMLSKNPSLIILINISLEAIGGIPTIVKSYLEPDSEEFLSWLMVFIATVFEVFTIQHWNITETYPIYLCIYAGIIVLLTVKSQMK